MFSIALSNVLVTLFYIVPGFLMKKYGKANEKHLGTISGILIYAGTPFLMLSAFTEMEFSWTYTADLLLFLGVTLIIQAVFLVLLFILLRRRNTRKDRVMNTAAVMGNVGFFGLPIVRALFPDHPEAACFSAATMVSMNILVFTVGVYCLTGEKKYISVKNAILNPTVISFVVSILYYISGIRQYIPQVMVNAIASLGNITTPLCMLMLGIRLASTPFKATFSDPKVYLSAALKLLALPLFAYLCVLPFGFSTTFKTCAMVLLGTPTAAVVLSLAEIYDSETGFSSACILVSTLLCFITIPLLTLLV